MEPRDYPSRYLHISGAFALGGTFTHVAPGVDVQIPTVAPVHLPMAGGISEAKVKKVSLNCKKVKFGPIDRKLLSKLKKRELFSIGSAYTLCKSEPESSGMPYRNNCVSEISSLRLGDKVFLKHSLLKMQSSHDPAQTRFPQITFDTKTEIKGLKLGRSELKITLDLETLNRYPTLEELENAFKNDPKVRARLTPRFLVDPATGGFYRNPSGYVIGSMVEKIEGLPSDASYSGYTVSWPPFGNLILGEMTITPYMRRVALIRFTYSDGSGCGLLGRKYLSITPRSTILRGCGVASF